MIGKRFVGLASEKAKPARTNQSDAVYSRLYTTRAVTRSGLKLGS